MPQTINTNLISLNAQRNMNGSQALLSTSMQRLSSGMRVNSAKDDAAGLAIAERMNSQVKGMNVAIRNANDGISMVQVAEGALGKISDMLQRMRELSVQSANGTNTSSDQTSMDKEFQALAAEVSRTLGGTRFNGHPVIGAGTDTTTFQVGAGTTTNDTIDIGFKDLSAAGTSLAAAIDTATMSLTGDNAAVHTVIDALDKAISEVNDQRATLGAAQNRFDAVISTLQVSSENQAASRARIMDADYAMETANLSRAQVLQQAGNAMVAQANQLPQQVMSLLKG